MEGAEEILLQLCLVYINALEFASFLLGDEG